MKKNFLILSALTVFNFLLQTNFVYAQETKIMRENEITESAVIDALAPEKSIRMRSFRPADTQLQTESGEPVSASMLITFRTNSAELTDSAKLALDKVGRALNMDRLAEFKFMIEGHADKSGSYQLNQRLSKARAESVMNYLVYRHAVNRSRLAAIGKGYAELLNRDNPLAPENRRVTLVRIGSSGDKR